MTTKLITWADGRTEQTITKCPKGAVTLCTGKDECERVARKLRLAYDGKTMLVPGVPEQFYAVAGSEKVKQAKSMDAFLAFKSWINGGKITTPLVMS